MLHRLRQGLPGLGFLLPALVLFLVFVLYPIIYNVQASLLDWDGVNAGTFVGLGNFVKLLQDPIFLTALRNSAYWIPLTIVPQAVIGFLLAMALNSTLRGSSVYRALFFIPAVLSPVVVGIVWQRILDPSSGVITAATRALGLTGISTDWLSDPHTAIFAVIAVNIWMWTGFSMLFYLAGLQLVDTSVLEAAKIDGASGLQTVTRIIFPLLRTTHLSLLLLGIIGSLKTFELVYVLTQGGPNNSSQMLPTYGFLQAFQLQSVGYASSISVVLIIIAVASSLGMVRVFGSGFVTGDKR
ncbi:sugar ABC transporter permease [Nakamurella flavida]|uniref:Sugar ABC transporter permease n=1 Tax=Nakamurella flavida TaxID=363630 RepID=A0A938YS26_9ACTN|nr:sugar ABC transporter permease [Nakamurella flavida]MBM9477850.1 sugar ABC transporter permease [Nakamurella flavida]MDP9779404.1 ABC-type sugar transport system permease subunit [Nakamurella flavida]